MEKVNYKQPVVVNVTEFTQILKIYCTNDFSFAIRVDGFPGVGKSEIIETTVKELNLPLVETRLAFKENPDLTGVQVPDLEKKLSVYLKPEDLPTEKNTVWFIDEVNRVYHPSIFNTLFQMISKRQVGVHPLPEGIKLIYAGNLGEEDNTIVTEFSDSALDTRYMWYKLQPTFKEWKEYAEKNGISNIVIGFLDLKTEYFAKYTGRVWYQISELINKIPNFREHVKTNTVYQKMISALSSEEVVNEMIYYIKSLKEISPEQVLASYKKYKKDLKKMKRESLFSLNNSLKSLVEGYGRQLNKDEILNLLSYIMEILDRDTAAAFVSDIFRSKNLLVPYVNLKDNHNVIPKEVNEFILEHFFTK